MSKIKYVLPFAISAFVACKKEIQPTPEPPKPVTPTAIGIRTTADMTTNMSIAAQNKNKKYAAKIENDVGVITTTLPIVGNWVKMDSAQTNLETDWGDFGVFFETAEMLGYQLWADNGSLDIKPNPTTGAIPMVSEADYAKFAAVGENDVVKVKEQTQIFELTAEEAKNFNLTIKRLVTRNPNEILNVTTPDVYVSNDSIYTFLRTLHVDNRSAVINIVDAQKALTDLNIAQTYIGNLDYGLNMPFIFASGMETQIWIKHGNVPQIIFPVTEKNMLTLDMASGKKNIAIIEIDNGRMPSAGTPVYSTDGVGLSSKCNFEWDAQKYGIYVSSGLSSKIDMLADADIVARSANEAKVVNHLFNNNGILVTNRFEDVNDVLGGELHGRTVLFWNPPMWVARIGNRFADKERYVINLWNNPNKRPGLPPPSNDVGTMTRVVRNQRGGR